MAYASHLFQKLTPEWIPAGRLWGYLTGVALLVDGGAILINKKARISATWVGLWIALLVVFLYLPILAAAKLPSGMNEAINYIGDTPLFSGTNLLIAAAVPASSIYSDVAQLTK